MKKVYYQISDPSQNIPEGCQNWIKQLKHNKTMCDCLTIIKPIEVDVYLNSKIKKGFAPITFARGTGIWILRKDLVLVLGLDNIEKVYYIGKVYDVNKNISEEYISIVPKVEIFIRGGKESTCNICDKCGTILYFPLPIDNWYLADKNIPNFSLFPSGLAGIIVNDEIFKKLKKSGIKKIGYEKLPVLEEAVDGNDSYFE